MTTENVCWRRGRTMLLLHYEANWVPAELWSFIWGYLSKRLIKTKLSSGIKPQSVISHRTGRVIWVIHGSVTQMCGVRQNGKMDRSHTSYTVSTSVLCLCVWFVSHRSMCLKHSPHPAKTAQWVSLSVCPSYSLSVSLSSNIYVFLTHITEGQREQPTIVNWPTVYLACWHTISVITWAGCQIPGLI